MRAVQFYYLITKVEENQGLKKNLRNEGNTFALQMARPSRGSDDHVKWWSRLQKETLI